MLFTPSPPGPAPTARPPLTERRPGPGCCARALPLGRLRRALPLGTLPARTIPHYFEGRAEKICLRRASCLGPLTLPFIKILFPSGKRLIVCFFLTGKQKLPNLAGLAAYPLPPAGHWCMPRWRAQPWGAEARPAWERAELGTPGAAGGQRHGECAVLGLGIARG